MNGVIGRTPRLFGARQAKLLKRPLRWHWPRYRLRTLLSLILIYCLLLTWFGIRWRWQDAQREILRSLDRFGPSVVSSGGDIVVLSLKGTEIRDVDLRNVGKLKS